jgi:hypothetical protein
MNFVKPKYPNHMGSGHHETLYPAAEASKPLLDNEYRRVDSLAGDQRVAFR